MPVIHPYRCKRCSAALDPNFDHVSPTCPSACDGTFSHPNNRCILSGRDVGHDAVRVEKAP